MVLMNEGASDPKTLHLTKRPDGYRLVYRGNVLGVPMSARGVRGVARQTLLEEEQRLERMERQVSAQRAIVEQLRIDVEAIEQEIES